VKVLGKHERLIEEAAGEQHGFTPLDLYQEMSDGLSGLVRIITTSLRFYDFYYRRRLASIALPLFYRPRSSHSVVQPHQAAERRLSALSAALASLSRSFAMRFC
jgi:hypothetical protein